MFPICIAFDFCFSFLITLTEHHEIGHGPAAARRTGDRSERMPLQLRSTHILSAHSNWQN
jgi:hypothetical protein